MKWLLLFVLLTGCSINVNHVVNVDTNIETTIEKQIDEY